MDKPTGFGFYIMKVTLFEKKRVECKFISQEYQAWLVTKTKGQGSLDLLGSLVTSVNTFLRRDAAYTLDRSAVYHTETDKHSHSQSHLWTM